MSPWPIPGDYPSDWLFFVAGALLFAVAVAVAVAMMVIDRAHEDLGRNWSNTLELRESHELVAHGIYRRIGPEEQMMREQFGAAYDEYRARTKRLIRGIF